MATTPDISLKEFITHLLNFNGSISDLLEKTHLNESDLERFLDSQEMQDHLTLRTKLARTQAKLHLTTLLPQAIQKLGTLLHADKPEVVRRATMAILHFNGISTKTPTPPKTKTPPEKPLFTPKPLPWATNNPYFESYTDPETDPTPEAGSATSTTDLTPPDTTAHTTTDHNSHPSHPYQKSHQPSPHQPSPQHNQTPISTSKIPPSPPPPPVPLAVRLANHHPTTHDKHSPPFEDHA